MDPKFNEKCADKAITKVAFQKCISCKKEYPTSELECDWEEFGFICKKCLLTMEK